MLRGYRLAIAAACGLTLVVALGTGAFFGSLYSPDSKHYQTVAGEQGGQNDYAGPSQSLPDISGLPGPVERAIANPHPATGSDNEKRDLAAQEASALWAFWMVIASGFGFVITTIATILLYQQIKLTREAVEHTGLATEAMREANGISDRNARREQRAYFIPENINSGVRTDKGMKYLDLRVEWRNFGSTPASNLRILAQGLFDNFPTEAAFVFEDKLMRGLIGQGAVALSNRVVLSLEEVHDVWSERRKFFILGHAEYTDVFGDEVHTTTHCWQIIIFRYPDKPLDGDNISHSEWTAVGPLNDAT